MFLIDAVILVSGRLLLLGIVSSKLSARLGVPVLVLFLLLGMLAGSEGIGGLEFENYQLAHAIGTLALAMILFDGGRSTSLSAIKVAWKPATMLATVGVMVTAMITGLAASWILQISPLEGMLLGSIVSSTDAAAVFAILRSGEVNLPKRIAAVLEVESVDGGRKWWRGGGVAAVEIGGAHACSSASWEDGGWGPDLAQIRRETQECVPTWSSGKRCVGGC